MSKEISAELRDQLKREGVDVEKMQTFLHALNEGKYEVAASLETYTVPDWPHPAIYDRRTTQDFFISKTACRNFFESFGLTESPEALGAVEVDSETYLLPELSLKKIGIYLYPKTAYGVLNGGSASSYVDTKKNTALDTALFEQYKAQFESLAHLLKGLPKGITPAYINPDGSNGYSFLFLKLKMLLEHMLEYKNLFGSVPSTILPFFQMTSLATHEAIMDACTEYEKDPSIKKILDTLGLKSLSIFTETQGLMAALTHSSQGKERALFDTAWGKKDTGLAMPGGHGQSFEVLAPIYRTLLDQGIRFVWLGNIDNLGYTVDPVSLALFALSGKDAAFEESWRTPIDVKGGILVQRSDAKLTVADIGPAISTEEMLSFEKKGKPVLFNCGIGLFDLQKLCAMLDTLPYKLPLRITDQDKDAGKYAQAEQITWEVIGLLENPLFFAVEKSSRFLAAKLLMEMLLTSSPPLVANPLSLVAQESHKGLMNLLEKEYALVIRNNRWESCD